MTDRFLDEAESQMGAVERLLKGLPVIGDYVDKELRRDADRRLRMLIADQLDEQKGILLEIQNTLLKSGGLKWLDDVNVAIQKLQNLIDRVRTASYGYAGFFDAVRIRENELNALHRFDVALAERVASVQDAVQALQNAVANGEALEPIIDRLTNVVADLNRLFDKRREAIISPELLTDTAYLPDVDESYLDAAP